MLELQKECAKLNMAKQLKLHQTEKLQILKDTFELQQIVKEGDKKIQDLTTEKLQEE